MDRWLLLHGFLGSARNLGGIARGLGEAGIAADTVDLLGHGDAPPLPDHADLEDLAAAVLALDRPRIVGHSLGGRVALMAKRLAPHAVERITLLDITAAPITRRSQSLAAAKDVIVTAPAETETREQMRAALSALDGPIADWLLMNVRRIDGRYRWTIDRAALLAFDARASAKDLWDAVDESVDVVRAGRSPYVSDEDVAHFESLGAKVTTIEHAGHFVHVDATDEVVSLLRKG